jgi:exodeoxyribonuclease III
MRIISYNVNGIRAAIGKGLLDWLRTDPADVICIQETKASKENVNPVLFNELGYEDYWFSAQKKGYSGVAIFTRIKPDNVQYGTGHKVSDDEGRVLQMDFGDLRLINAYFPSGTSGDLRQNFGLNLCCAVITILHTRKLISMIRKEIRIARAFCPQRGNGWINSSAMDGRTHSGNFTPSRTGTVGGASDFQR